MKAPKAAASERRFLGMTAFQRFVLALMLFIAVCVLGSMLLVGGTLLVGGGRGDGASAAAGFAALGAKLAAPDRQVVAAHVEGSEPIAILPSPR